MMRVSCGEHFTPVPRWQAQLAGAVQTSSFCCEVQSIDDTYVMIMNCQQPLAYTYTFTYAYHEIFMALLVTCLISEFWQFTLVGLTKTHYEHPWLAPRLEEEMLYTLASGFDALLKPIFNSLC